MDGGLPSGRVSASRLAIVPKGTNMGSLHLVALNRRFRGRFQEVRELRRQGRFKDVNHVELGA